MAVAVAVAAAAAAAALGREEAEQGAERPRAGPRGEMASYVDNSFRQAVMKNPAERTPQVRPAGARGPRLCWQAGKPAVPAASSLARLLALPSFLVDRAHP